MLRKMYSILLIILVFFIFLILCQIRLELANARMERIWNEENTNQNTNIEVKPIMFLR